MSTLARDPKNANAADSTLFKKKTSKPHNENNNKANSNKQNAPPLDMARGRVVARAATTTGLLIGAALVVDAVAVAVAVGAAAAAAAAVAFNFASSERCVIFNSC